MALSLVASIPQQQQHHHHHNQYSYFDLQSFLDPYSLENQSEPQTHSNYTSISQATNQQQHLQHQRPTKIVLTNFNNSTDLMEFNSGNNNGHNSNNIPPTTLQQNSQITTNISQLSNSTNRNLMSGFHHQHFGAEYEPVITFVDSPPNSEESWPDDQSKDSPGPQIIDVQTIYSNSGSRKRRMDWDPLDIGQSESTASTQTGELPAKISAHQILEKDKYKKERLSSGRATWGDDIGFDLNAEFNSNSYLNNESFMNFASGLPTALKQEPQTDQLKNNNKSSLNIHQDPGNLSIATKNDKPPMTTAAIVAAAAAVTPGGHIETSTEKLNKNDLIDSHCILDQNSSENKTNNQNSEQARNTSISHQLLTVVDASKIEQITAGRDTTATSTTTSNCDDYKFQYILGAATSIATKNNEDTLTYLNQGQSYEIKLKKIGDLSLYRDKILKSVIKICFHERRLQYMEREQMQQWQASRPGERIIEVDLPLSYGLCHVSQPLNPNYLNTVEILWDPMKEVGVYIKVNCISTEFTPKKHGGEKGVPFRLQIETYVESSNNNNINNNSTGTGTKSPLSLQAATSPPQAGNLTPNGSVLGLGVAKHPIHAAACQIKVFKLKGADRKHKQDREKIQKRPQSEQDKFQPSYECTIMTDIPLDLIAPTTTTTNSTNGCFSPEYMKVWPNSPVHMPKYDGIIPFTSASPNANNASPIAINSVSSTNSTNLKIMDPNNMVNTPSMLADIDEYNSITIMPESTPAQVTHWLTYHRLTSYLSTFAHFSGADIMRMSKEDLIQICGLADGIRMFNILRAKAITPRLTIYVSLDGSNYNAVYLISNTSKELLQKLFKLPGFYEIVAKSSTHNGGTAAGAINSMMENSAPFHSWGMHSKYSGSGSNIFNDVNNKSLIYVTGPAGIHVAVTDEVLNNEIRDGSLYGLEVQNGKVIMKLINKNEN